MIPELISKIKRVKPRFVVDPSTGQLTYVSMTEKKGFEDGFEKAAAADSLIGVMKNLRSGLRKYKQGGQVKSPTGPKPGVFIAPRSDMPPLPTMVKVNPNKNLSASIPFKRVNVPKPPNR